MSSTLPEGEKQVGKGLRHAVTIPVHPKAFPSPFAFFSLPHLCLWLDLCSSGLHIRRLPPIILCLIYTSLSSLLSVSSAPLLKRSRGVWRCGDASGVGSSDVPRLLCKIEIKKREDCGECELVTGTS